MVALEEKSGEQQNQGAKNRHTLHIISIYCKELNDGNKRLSHSVT